MDHAAWARDWPLPVRNECELIFGAMGPRILVAPYIPNQDYRGNPVPAAAIAEELRRHISQITGGQTKYRHGEGDYRPRTGAALAEETLVIETFLPTVVSDALRVRLIGLFVELGRRTLQDAVQVQVGFHGFWIPTGLFRHLNNAIGGANTEAALKLG